MPEGTARRNAFPKRTRSDALCETKPRQSVWRAADGRLPDRHTAILTMEGKGDGPDAILWFEETGRDSLTILDNATNLSAPGFWHRKR